MQKIAESSISFNLMAVVRSREAIARESGDKEALQVETMKRKRYARDNAFRSHNWYVWFVPSVNCPFFEVVRNQLSCATPIVLLKAASCFSARRIPFLVGCMRQMAKKGHLLEACAEAEKQKAASMVQAAAEGK